MPRGLHRLTGIANTIQAREDWRELSCMAISLGMRATVKALEPPANAGWRVIDKRIAELRRLMESPDAD